LGDWEAGRIRAAIEGLGSGRMNSHCRCCQQGNDHRESDKTMKTRRIERAAIEHLSTVEGPIGAVVIVSNDLLTDAECQSISRVWDRGCRMFMCVGWGAEMTHDLLDEYLISQPLDDVAMTTFHDVDEPLEDVAALLVVYMREQQSSAVLLIDFARELTDRLIEQNRARRDNLVPRKLPVGTGTSRISLPRPALRA
jgi:hypothetical protein